MKPQTSEELARALIVALEGERDFLVRAIGRAVAGQLLERGPEGASALLKDTLEGLERLASEHREMMEGLDAFNRVLGRAANRASEGRLVSMNDPRRAEEPGWDETRLGTLKPGDMFARGEWSYQVTGPVGLNTTRVSLLGVDVDADKLTSRDMGEWSNETCVKIRPGPSSRQRGEPDDGPWRFQIGDHVRKAGAERTGVVRMHGKREGGRVYLVVWDGDAWGHSEQEETLVARGDALRP